MNSYDELRHRALVRWQTTDGIPADIPNDQWRRFCDQNPEVLADFKALLEDDREDDAWAALDRSWGTFRKKGRKRWPSPSRHQPKPNTDPRWTALMQIVRMRADQHPDVVRFRTDVLGDQLVLWDRISEWMKTAADNDGEPTTWITVPADDDGRPLTPSRARKLGNYREHRESIRYVVPDDPFVKWKSIRLGGTLWELRRVARQLVRGIGWPEWWTVTYVVTGEIPDRPFVFSYDEHDVHRTELPALDWLELRVNPRAVSPVDLRAVYRRIRSEMMGSKPDDERRARPLSKKKTELAIFWERTQGMTTADRRNEWNRLHPEWIYPDTSGNFARDGRKAHRDVTGEEGME